MSVFTTSLHLELKDFNIVTWHDAVNGNFTILDAAFRALTGLVTQGIWLNNTVYTIGQRAIDNVTGNIWTVSANHTSAAAPTTFAQDRVAHPTYWTLFTAAVNNRGAWVTATNYNVNDFLSDNNRFGVVKTAYTSGASYNVDVANGNITTLIDMTAYVTGGIGQSINAATAKATPVGADQFGYANSADSNNLVKFTYTQMLAAIFNAPTIVSPTMTGSPVAPTPAITSDDTSVATTAYVDNKCEVQARRNLITNPSMQISQENSTVAGGTTGYHAADEWAMFFSTSAGVLSFQNVVSVTPNGERNRVRLSVTTADAALAAGEFLYIRQMMEGYTVAALQWGTASAKTLRLRFGFKGPAGTYTVAVRNSANDRAYVREFTISGGQANTDTEQSLTFPGDTAGTWLNTNGIGIQLIFALATGSTFQTTPNAWQAGSFFGTAASSNGLAVNTNVFELFDVSAYGDFEGIAGVSRWVSPLVNEVLARCQRYYVNNSFLKFTGDTTNTVAYGVMAFFPVAMRAAPTIAQVNVSNTNFGATPGIFAGSNTTTSFQSQRTATGTGGGAYTETWEANARLQ